MKHVALDQAKFAKFSCKSSTSGKIKNSLHVGSARIGTLDIANLHVPSLSLITIIILCRMEHLLMLFFLA